jgi:hypothetical protein
MFHNLLNRIKTATRGLPSTQVRPRKQKATYIAPAVVKHDPEIAKLMLVARAWEGDEAAASLLMLLFPLTQNGDATTGAHKLTPASTDKL